MPYFPMPSERAYACKGCGGRFIPSGRSCLVMHAPGTCCHEYEQRVSDAAPRVKAFVAGEQIHEGDLVAIGADGRVRAVKT